jgi:IS1 family transposase
VALAQNFAFKLLMELRPYIAKDAVIISDKHPHYLQPLKDHFPDCVHKSFKGSKGSVTGQGELKKIGYDPLFTINQTFAMLRDNLKRLSRRTWCTTKKIQALDDQIAIYVDFHNQFLKTKRKNLRKFSLKAS